MSSFHRVKQEIKKIPNIHRPDGRPNVLLYSTPRSGSTWLMELIWSQPGFKYCAEPLNIRNPDVRKHLGLDDWSDLYSTDAEVTVCAYLQAFLDGRLRFKNPNPFKGYFRPVTHRIVFKEIHGPGSMISVLQNQLNARVVYLLRHPIPVTLSRRELPTLKAFLDSDYRHNFSNDQLRLSRHIVASGTHLERGVLAWCLQNAVPLSNVAEDWVVLTYEQLVVDPAPAIHYMAPRLELPRSDRILRRLTIPSGVKGKSDAETQKLLKEREVGQRRVLIEKWRGKVSDSDERRAMSVLNWFGIDAYDAGRALPADWLWI